MAVNCDCLCISYFLFILLPRKLSFNANSNKDCHYIREQKAIPSVRTSCINTCVSIGIIPASIFGSGSSSKYCLYRAWNIKMRFDDASLKNEFFFQCIIQKWEIHYLTLSACAEVKFSCRLLPVYIGYLLCS